jgi:Fur family ferric uptake transcriptional regulator
MSKVNNKLLIEATLRAYGLKVTRPRVKILRLLLGHGSALSFPEIEKKIKRDPATVYGLLRTLELKGVIYKLYDHRRIIHFALESPEHAGSLIRLHFNCTACNQLYPLPQPQIELPMPEDFSAEKIEWCVFGECDACCRG